MNDGPNIPIPPGLIGDLPRILQKAFGILAQMQTVADEMRAERHRQEALTARLEAMFASAAPSRLRTCSCPPAGLSVVLAGGICAECGGMA